MNDFAVFFDEVFEVFAVPTTLKKAKAALAEHLVTFGFCQADRVAGLRVKIMLPGCAYGLFSCGPQVGIDGDFVDELLGGVGALKVIGQGVGMPADMFRVDGELTGGWPGVGN